MFSFVFKNIDYAHKLDKPSRPTEEYYKHMHSFCEILYLVRGNVMYTVESESKKLSEGDIVFIPMGKYHFATVDLSVPYERYVLKLPANSIPDFVWEKLKKHSSFYSNCKKFAALFNQFDQYFDVYDKEELFAMLTCDTLKLIVQLCHETAQPMTSRNLFIEKLLDYIDANLTSPLTIQTLQDEFHYSKSYINTEFKRHMQIPIMQYVRSKKIFAAHQMILSGTKKSEAAEMFGFETYSTFYRTYKKFIESNNVHMFD